MAEFKTVRKASVEITAPGGKGSAEGITITAAVDTVTSVQVVMHRATGKVVRPLAGTMLKAMADVQKARFEPKVQPDTSVTASDGNGGTFSFRGYSVAASLGQSKVSNEETIHVIGFDSQLDGLNMSIYGSRADQRRAETPETSYTATPNSKTGNIAQLILEISDVLYGNFQATLDDAQNGPLKELLQRKHESNHLPLEIWTHVLRNSKVDYPEWAAAFAERPMLRISAAERTKEMLQQKSSSFWSTVAGLGAEFQFFYRPKMTGGPGGFFRADVKTGPPVRTIPLGVTRFSASDGSTSTLPLAGVVLFGPPQPGWRMEDAPIGTSGAVIGRWPPAPATGFYFQSSPPSWLETAGGFLALAPSAIQGPPAPATAPKNYDPAGYGERRTGLRADGIAAGDLVGQMLQAYAKVMYEDMKYADSTATLELPLDFTLEVGVRYKFELVKEGASFTGFVRALSHTLQLQGGTSMVSYSTLTLTHVIY